MWLKRHFGRREGSLEKLGALESEVMDILWKRGEISVRDVYESMRRRLAYTTVMTTLDRLYKKGLLCRRKQGKAFHYAAVMSSEQYQTSLASHLFGMVLNDHDHTLAVLSRFVDAVSEADEKMLEELDELVKSRRRALRDRES